MDRFITDRDFTAGGDAITYTPTQAAQAAINEATYGEAPGTKYGRQQLDVVLMGDANGRLDLDKGLHLGHEANLVTPWLRGIGMKHRNSSANVGTSLVANFTNEPIISVHGAYFPRISDLHLEGAMTGYAALSTRDEDLWLLDSDRVRHSPHLGIAFNTHSGAEPVAASYPDYEVPTYIKASGFNGYGAGQACTNMTVERVSGRNLDGFIASGLALQQGNDDFLKVFECNVENCGVGIGFAHPQGRNASIRNLTGQHVMRMFSGKTFGLRNGRIGGHIDTCGFYDVGVMFDLTTTEISGTVSVTALDCEELYQLYRSPTQNGLATSMYFRGGRLSMNWSEKRPEAFIQGRTPANLKFENMIWENHDGILSVQPKNTVIENVRVRPLVGSELPAATHDYLSGSVFTLNPRPCSIQFKDSTGSDASTNPFETVEPLNAPLLRFEPGEGHKPSIVVKTLAGGSQFNLTPTVVDDEFLGTYYAGDSVINSMVAGDLVCHENSGAVFMVTAQAAGQLTLVAKTGHDFDFSSAYWKFIKVPA